jgi:hypothetical protein
MKMRSTRPGPASTVLARLVTDVRTTKAVVKSGRSQIAAGTGTTHLKVTGSRRMPRSV